MFCPTCGTPNPEKTTGGADPGAAIKQGDVVKGVIVRTKAGAPGGITLRAESAGLAAGEVTLNTQ